MNCFHEIVIRQSCVIRSARAEEPFSLKLTIQLERLTYEMACRGNSALRLPRVIWRHLSSTFDVEL